MHSRPRVQATTTQPLYKCVASSRAEHATLGRALQATAATTQQLLVSRRFTVQRVPRRVRSHKAPAATATARMQGSSSASPPTHSLVARCKRVLQGVTCRCITNTRAHPSLAAAHVYCGCVPGQPGDRSQTMRWFVCVQASTNQTHKRTNAAPPPHAKPAATSVGALRASANAGTAMGGESVCERAKASLWPAQLPVGVRMASDCMNQTASMRSPRSQQAPPPRSSNGTAPLAAPPPRRDQCAAAAPFKLVPAAA